VMRAVIEPLKGGMGTGFCSWRKEAELMGSKNKRGQ
jgi:hypothetical protein